MPQAYERDTWPSESFAHPGLCAGVERLGARSRGPHRLHGLRRAPRLRLHVVQGPRRLRVRHGLRAQLRDVQRDRLSQVQGVHAEDRVGGDPAAGRSALRRRRERLGSDGPAVLDPFDHRASPDRRNAAPAADTPHQAHRVADRQARAAQTSRSTSIRSNSSCSLWRERSVRPQRSARMRRRGRRR